MPNSLIEVRESAEFILKHLQDVDNVDELKLREIIFLSRYMKKIASLRLIQVIAPKCINWAEDWNPFDFSGLEKNQIQLEMARIEGVAKEGLVGTGHTIVSMRWQQRGSTSMFDLIVCLDPSARRRPVGGGPGGSMDPELPGKP